MSLKEQIKNKIIELKTINLVDVFNKGGKYYFVFTGYGISKNTIAPAFVVDFKINSYNYFTNSSQEGNIINIYVYDNNRRITDEWTYNILTGKIVKITPVKTL